MNGNFEYPVVVSIIIILSLSPVLGSFVEVGGGEELHSEELYSVEPPENLEVEHHGVEGEEEFLHPVEVLYTDNLIGEIDYLKHDPESEDAYENWYEAEEDEQGVSDNELDVAMDQPEDELEGEQNISLLLRRTDNSERRERLPEFSIELNQNGESIFEYEELEITDTEGEVMYFDFDTSDLSDPSGEGITLELQGLRTGGAQENRNTVEYGAIEWNAVTTEESFEDNLLTWEASPDEIESYSYNVSRSEVRDGDYEKIATVEADGSEEYQYIDEGKGAADDTIWWYKVSAVDGDGQESESTDEVQEPGPRPPTNPDPEDGAEDVSMESESSVNLSVNVSHVEGEIVDNVTFYTSDDDLIGFVNNVSDGTRTDNVTWENLEPGETYYWYTVAEEEEIGNVTSETWSFTTYADDPTVETLTAQDVTTNSAMLRGEVTSLGDYDEVEAYFRYRIEDDNGWEETEKQTIEDLMEFNRSIDGLQSNATYEFKSVMEWGDEEEEEGGSMIFTTLKEAFFEVEIVEYNDAVNKEENEELVVDYTITNIGEVTDTKDINFLVYDYFGDEVYSDFEPNIELNESEVYDDIFRFGTDEVGEYSFKVWTEDDEEVREFLVFEQPYFRMTIDEPEEGKDYLEGEPLTVEYTVENLGLQEDTQDIQFYVDSELIATEEEVELDGEETHSGSFDWTSEEPYGDRYLTVVSEDDSDTVTITVLEEAFFEVEIHEPEMEERYFEGQTVVVEYTVKNTGDATDTQDIVFSIDGEDETEIELELGGGEIDEGEFTWIAEDPYGERDFTVESEDDQVGITIIVEEAPEEPFFDVFIMDPSDGEEYIEDEVITIEYKIENLGEETGVQDIELKIDGEILHIEEEIELDGGASYSDTYNWTADAPYGERLITMESEDDDDTETVAVLEKAFFEVEILEPIEGENYYEGQRVTVRYEVENTGDVTDIQNITFTVLNEEQTEGNLGLEGGEVYQGDFLWIAENPGERELTVQSEDDADKITILIEETPDEPFFDVYITSPSDGDQYVEDDEVQIEFNLMNLGDQTGTQDIELKIDGEGVNVEEGVELSGGSSYSGTFNWTANEPYEERSLTVESEDDSDVVEILVLEQAYFEIEITEPIEGEKFIEDEPVSIKYRVENTGDVTYIQDIQFYLDGELSEIRRNLGLEGDEVYEGNFIWLAEKPHEERHLTVLSNDDSAAVTVMVVEDPYFDVEITEPVDGEEYVEGETVDVEYSVENIGYVGDTQEIEFYVNGDFIDADEGVELDGGETHNGTFNLDSEELYGEFKLEVRSDDGSHSVNITLLREAFFEVNIVDYDDQAVAGEENSVYYRVENIGDLPDIQDVTFVVYDDSDNEVYTEVIEDLELEGGQIYEDNFSWVVEEPGNYSFQISTENVNHHEEGIFVEVSTPADGWLSGMWLIYLILGIVGLSAIVGGGIYKTNLMTDEPVIEEVFLISKRNSMLLLHNSRRLRPERDSDIIAGMFEAVQNFIEDSFQDTGDWELNKLEFGGNNIVVERGEHVYMAVVYERELSRENIHEIRDVIERIENEYGEQLEHWDGDREEIKGLKEMTQDLFS